VACTADGNFYFGRLDLIGKGDHGRALKQGTSESYVSYMKDQLHYTTDQIMDGMRRLNSIAYLGQDGIDLFEEEEIKWLPDPSKDRIIIKDINNTIEVPFTNPDEEGDRI
jgi:hypothetical protein